MIRYFKTERNDISVYNTLHDEAVDLVEQFGIVSSNTNNRWTTKSCQTVGYRYQGLLANYTVLPVPRSLVERVKRPFGEKRRSISGIVIDTDQFKQTKTLQEDELHIYDAYRADLQTQEEFTLE